ncbi:MAG: gluconate 2-dehydrogenase subunit 3 family protein [Bryobacteraceae bacterium]
MDRRAWLAASAAAILEAQHHAREAVRAGKAPVFFTKAEAADVESLTAEIIPTTETPGARKAGVVHFIDRALTTFDRDNQPAYRDGLQAWNARRLEMFAGSASFAALTSAQRVAFLHSVETTPFFSLLRKHTMMGFLADPAYGGNPAGGYATLRFTPAHAYQPPFGWYDAKANGGEN